MSGKRIVVAGDAAVDWCLTEKEDETDWQSAKWDPERDVGLWGLKGGSLLLYDLIAGVLVDGFNIVGDSGEGHTDRASNRRYHQAHLTLHKYVDKRWRVARMQGIQRRPERCSGTTSSGHEDLEIAGDTSRADIVVINDNALDFRAVRSHWPKAIRGNSTPWVIVKLGGPGMVDGPLWSELQKKHQDRLIVVTTADDLRQYSEVQISKELSWERAAEDCAAALLRTKQVSALIKCRHVVVSFGPCGALLFDRDKSGIDRHPRSPEFTIFFDPDNLEGSARYTKNGEMWGYTSILVASISRQVMQACVSPDRELTLDRAILAGLATMKEAYARGFGPHAPLAHGGEGGEIDLPKENAAKKIKNQLNSEHPGTGFAHSLITPPSEDPPTDPAEEKTILGEKVTDHYEVATKVVLESETVTLNDVPHGRYGKLFTVDRHEIESLESIRGLIREYSKRTIQAQVSGKGEPLKPLSIAVFGQPGDGKSFAVKQIMKSLGEDRELKEFNLSQFTEVRDLENAFHVIRDLSLTGSLPFALWDEFDTHFNGDLGWLKYFLSPMEDGSFQQGETLHPIGRSVFFFAGGTSSSLRKFEENHGFKMAKGPDFLSRIGGHIDLQGSNPQEGDQDKYYLIRRAIILRSLLERHTSLKLDGGGFIDKGVLRAFLKVPEYKHGARSMRAIVEASSLSGKRFFGQSSLPAETQLDLHVDARTFLTIARGGDIDLF
ncbi:hypothetical protein OHB36_14360 [Streptomyces sp. NBC_00320]|uniref:hypothetical protein n=1 Tax=Streptomyces sp. NBC_00320 TaxID=2975711 RepID=UPI00225A3910|nr:hypothetical protein [Streptomyces sp. NBC_00320]MCX5147938.1 hypothetical protein [Streptomyces sp. NBC_00320]